MPYPYNATHPLQAQPPVAPRPTLGGSAGRSALADAMLRQAQNVRAPRTVLEGIGTQLAPTLIGALLKKQVADERSKFIAGLAGLKGPELTKALIASGYPAFATAGLNARMAAMAAADTQETFTPVLDADGKIIGQRSSLTGEVKTDPRTKKPSKRVPALNTNLTDNPKTPYDEQLVWATPDELGKPGFHPVKTPPLVTVGGDKQETAEAAKVGAYFGNLFVSSLEAAGAARKSEVSLNRFRQLQRELKDAGVDTGKGRKALTKVQSFAQTFFSGILPEDYFKGVGPSQAMEALRNLMALKLRTTEKLPASGFSDADREFLEAIPPGIEKSPKANALLTDYLRRINKRTIQIGRMATRYRKKHGSLDEGFLMEADAFAAANPLFTEKDITSVTDTVGAPPVPAPPPGYH